MGPPRIEEIIREHRDTLFTIFSNALPEGDTSDQTEFRVVLDRFVPSLGNTQTSFQLGVALIEGRTAQFLSEKFTDYIRQNTDIPLRASERRNTMSFLGTREPAKRLALRRSSLNKISAWAVFLADSLLSHPQRLMTDNEARMEVRRLVGPLDYFIRESRSISDYIHNYPNELTNATLYHILCAQCGAVSRLETGARNLYNLFLSEGANNYDEVHIRQLAHNFNAGFLDFANPFEFIRTLRDPLLRQGVQITVPQNIPSVIPADPNLIRELLEEVVMTVSEFGERNVSVDFSWVEKDHEIDMQIRGISPREFAKMAQLSPILSKLLSLDGVSPESLPDEKFMNLLLPVNLLDISSWEWYSPQGGGQSGAAPGTPTPTTPAAPPTSHHASNVTYVNRFAAGAQNFGTMIQTGRPITTIAIAAPAAVRPAPIIRGGLGLFGHSARTGFLQTGITHAFA